MPLPLTADDTWFNMADAMDEAALDSDSDLAPVCQGCDRPVDVDGYCSSCEEDGNA